MPKHKVTLQGRRVRESELKQMWEHHGRMRIVVGRFLIRLQVHTLRKKVVEDIYTRDFGQHRYQRKAVVYTI